MTPTPPEALSVGPELELTAEDPPDARRALLRAARDFPDAGVVTLDAEGRRRFRGYPELLERATAVLAGLRADGVRPGDRVILCGLALEEFFPAFWGCVLGGVQPAAIADRPAGPESPAAHRLRHVWGALDRPLVLTDEATAPAVAAAFAAAGEAGSAAGAGAGGGGAASAGTGGRVRTARVEEYARARPAGAAPGGGAGPDAGGPDGGDGPDASDTALLMLSSGSTGGPKAARVTHGALAEFAASSRRVLDLRPGDVTVNWLPVDHSGAFFLYHLLEVFAGRTNVHAPTDLVLADPGRWLDLLAEYRATHTWAPAFAFQLIAETVAERPDDYWDLGTVRSWVSGGEQTTLPVMRRFLAATEPFGVREEHVMPAWGMAETVTAVTVGRLGTPGAVHHVRRDSLGGLLRDAAPDAPEAERVSFVAVGPPVYRVALRIVDDRSRPLTERRIGRLQVRSGRLTPGYVDDPGADAAAYPDGPEWLDTGDLAFLADGQLVITGRRKDVLVLNGHNVPCHELEGAACEVSGVRAGDVAACGIPDEGSGTEVPAVFFVSRGAAEDARIAAEVRAAVFARLRITVPWVVPVPAAEFPRTPAGKVRRAELRDRPLVDAAGGPAPAAGAPRRPAGAGPAAGADPAAGAEHPEPAGTGPDGTEPPAAGSGGTAPDAQRAAEPVSVAAVAAEVAAVLGVDEAGGLDGAVLDTPFYELGLTSLLLTRLRGRLERRFGRPVAATACFEHPTARALAAHLAAGRAPAVTAAESAAAEAGAAVAPAVAVREPAAEERRVAIIGMAARLPGAATLERFWANLRDGVDSVRTFAAPDAEPADGGPGRARRVRAGGVLDDHDGFDAELFGMSPAEARLTHPEQRLFLECCHRALEHGGYAAWAPGTAIGVFAGCGMNLYGHQHGAAAPPAGDAPGEAMRAAIGRQPDFLATRVAYRLGLTGPAIGVQTACSTSLVAVHLAVQSLLSGDADLALAGAAAVHLPQESGYLAEDGSFLSPTGRCRAFDAAADGTVGGNGVAAVLLKRLDRALADGDTVHAVILGTAVNNDGAGKVGFSAPGLAGQAEVVRHALRRAGVPPESVGYVEAHATGTQLGDPVEFEALSRAFGEGAERRREPCVLGSVKPAIGHLDSCAGMAGLLKTVLMLRHRTLVPTLHLDRPNPALRLAESPFTLATRVREWRTEPGVPRRAGVSALGVGGTNAHLILQEAPAEPAEPPADGRPLLIPVSARDRKSLTLLVDGLARELAGRPGEPPPPIGRIAATLAHGRPHRPHRAAFVAADAAGLRTALAEFGARRAGRASTARLERPAFAYPGQGRTRDGLARALYRTFPQVRAVLDACEAVYAEEFGGSLLEPLLGSRADGPDGGADGGAGADGPAEGAGDDRWPTETAQPALFAHQLALTALWRAFGVRPAIVLGHSVGELAALCAGGALSLADGLRLTAWRGRLMQRHAPPGGMVAVRAEPSLVRRITEESRTELAAVNGPFAHVIAGPPEALHTAELLLEKEDLGWRRLPADRAFHSASLDEALREFRPHAERAAAAARPLEVPFAGALDGELRPAGWRLDADYLCLQARRPVRFDLAVAAVAEWGTTDFLETGAGDVLTGLGRHALPHGRWHTSQPRDLDAVRGMLTAAGELYERGVELTWSAMVPDEGRIPLPGHPQQRTAHPYPAPEDRPEPADRPAAATGGPGTADRRDATGTGRAAAPEAEVVAHAAGTAGPAGAEGPDGADGAGGTAEPGEPAARWTGRAAEEVTDTIRDLTARKLRTEPEQVTADRSFFDLGADSLMLMGMTGELGDRYGVRIPVRELFEGADTPRRLAELILRTLDADGTPLPSGPPAGGPAPAGGTAAAAGGAPDEAATTPDEGPTSGPGAAEAPVPAPAAPAVRRRAAGPAEPPPPPPPTTGPGPSGADPTHDFLGRQLRVAERLVDQITGLMARQLELLAGRPDTRRALPPGEGPAPRRAAAPVPGGPAGATGTAAPEAAGPGPSRTSAPTAPTARAADPAPTASAGLPAGGTGAAARAAAAPAAVRPSEGGTVDFSLYFFGDYPDDTEQDKYGLILAATEYADERGFHAVWLPERHFDSFGALFPNPAVLAAGLATRTSRVRLHAGSVVLPLHHPVRVAEEWSVVDNLSHGRAGLCVASGWHSRDFALAPDHYGRHRELMYEQLETVRTLWSGEPVTVPSGSGEPTEVRLYPRPLQERPPMYAAVVGNPESYRLAARHDLGIVTNLMAQSVEQLAENIARYRAWRAEYGLDPAAGRVVVLVHTYLGADGERARAEAYRPFVRYLRSSLGLFNQVTNSLGFEVDLRNTPEEDVDFLLGRAYERYCASRALIGDVRGAAETVGRLTEAGADEIACFVDFGVAPERVLAALPLIDRLRETRPPATPAAAPPPRPAPDAAAPEPAAAADDGGSGAAAAAGPEAAPSPASPAEPAPAPEPEPDAAPSPVSPAEPDAAPEPAPGPASEAAPAPGPGLASHPAPVPAPRPSAEPAPEPILEATPEPAPVAASRAESTPEPEPAAVRLELTGPQRRIWVTEQLHPGTSMYHEPKAIRLDGPLDVPAFQECLRRVVARQPALRTVFRSVDGRPYREVLPDLPLPCPVEEVPGLDVEQALRHAMETEGRRVFDLAEGPLVSARLLRLTPDCHLLFLLAHHIVFDSSSTAVLLEELAADYRAWPDRPADRPALPIRQAPPPDAERTAADLEFWREELADAPTLRLPTDHPRPPVRSGAGAGFAYRLDEELVRRVQRLAAGRRATLFMALTAALGAVLGRFAGQRDLVLGTAVSSRHADAAREIGVFLDTVALRLDLSEDPDFVTLLDRVRQRGTTAFEHRHVDFDELVGALNPHRDLGRNPLFQVLVEYENEQQVEFAPPRLHATALEVPSDRAPFDLSVYLTRRRDGLSIVVEYDTALFEESTVRRITGYVEELLRRAVDRPQAPLSELTALTEPDAATLHEWSGAAAAAAPEAEPAARTLHGLFEEQARRTPVATALVYGAERVSYRELAHRADRLARLLRSRGAGPGERVAVLLPRGPRLITALLAVLKSGAAYLPLDLSSPDARLALLIRDGRPALLLTSSGLLSAHPGIGQDSAQLPVVLIDDVPVPSPESELIAGVSAEDEPLPEVGPDDAAYCVHTSGSTGTPKGVIVPHRGPAGLVRWQLARHRPLRTLQWTSPSFDVSVQEIFSTLAGGGELVLIDDAVRYDPAALAETVRQHRVERMFMPCTPLRYLMETGPTMPSLRELLAAGEALELTAPLRLFLERHPRCVLYNQYGPTEASVIVASHRVDPAREERPPIGRPVDGARLELLDETGRPVPVGAAGELYIGGRPVADGYFGRPAETAAAFVRGPAGDVRYRTGDLARWRPDGLLEYLGRTDDQVKIRGFRVEPAEVQAVLRRRPEVGEAVVLPRRDAAGEAELVAYVVPAEPAGGLGHLPEALAAELPDHLVPRRWVRLERLPVNTAGKLDRDGLPAPDAGADAGAAPAAGPAAETGPGAGGAAGADADAPPSSEEEWAVHALWCELLDRPRLPVDRSFFLLGGHSLTAIRLLNRLSAGLGLRLSIADFFRAPTIRATAARLAALGADSPDAPAAAPVDAAPAAPAAAVPEPTAPPADGPAHAGPPAAPADATPAPGDGTPVPGDGTPAPGDTPTTGPEAGAPRTDGPGTGGEPVPDPATAVAPAVAPPAPAHAAAGPAVADRVELTSAQRRLWRRHHEHGLPAVLNVAHRVDIDGDVDVAALTAALAAVVRRHAALRGRLVVRDDAALFEVADEVEVELPVSDLTAPGVGPEAVDGWCTQLAGRPFALHTAPLFRFRLARLDERRWVLLVVLHHAVCDGWSLGIIWHELQFFYNAHRAGHTPDPGVPAAQFTDWARTERRALTEARRAELAEYWRNELAGAALFPAPPCDGERPARLSGRGGLVELPIDAAAAKAVATAAAGLGCTAYTVVAGAFAVWLARLCEQPDLAFAISSANRAGGRQPHIESVVGMVGEPVALRARVGEAATFRELCGRLGETLYHALDHQQLPLAEVLEAVRSEPAEASPRVLFSVITTPRPRLDLEGVRTHVRSLPVAGTARTELYVVLVPEEDGIRLMVEYSTDLFTAETVTAWSRRFITLLTALTADPSAALPAVIDSVWNGGREG